MGASLSEYFDYTSDPKMVVGYEEDKEKETIVNVYDYINNIDQALNKYLKDVVKKMDLEKNYGLSKSAIQIDDKSVTYESANNIEAKAEELQKEWKKVKEKIERATLEKRIEDLNAIIDSCDENYIPSIGDIGLELTKEERENNAECTEHKKSAENFLYFAEQRLGELK